MTICVLNTGSVQSINRTIALSKYATIISFLETGKLTENHKLLKERGIAVESLQYRGFRAWSIAKYLTKINADIFLCFYASGVHIDACLYAKVKRLAIVAMGSDILEQNRDIITRKKIVNGLKKASMISAKSLDIIDAIKFQKKIETETYLNYWGSDIKRFSEVSKIDSRKLLGLPENRTILLSPRTFHELYNIELIVGTFIELKKSVDNLYCVFIGRAPDQIYYEKIKSILEKELDGNFRLDGEVSNERIKYYYKASDIVYSFAEREGFPNTVLETFASGTNLLCGEIENLSNSFLKDNVNVTFAKFNVSEIKEKTELILNDSKYASDIRKNAFTQVVKYGDIEKNAEGLVRQMENCQIIEKHFPFALLFFDIISVLSRFLKGNKSSGRQENTDLFLS
jgi:glycosyltransferase involved in cell wall biosynthesis